LQSKTFLDGEGFEVGNRDKEVFENLKNANLEGLPNIQRWFNFMSKKSQQ